MIFEADVGVGDGELLPGWPVDRPEGIQKWHMEPEAGDGSPFSSP
ncbi:hypothetical protein ACFQMH_25270 [Streptomyces viridiviolaceus]|uniref:Uncharacterized protein n=1 Tax=Streptomyces viridiviolaceus TaxID=68282 RepID=A0ABW2E4A5_9ACTN|nr:hypothetical protein [Streptomyces viridiviolaceus]